MSERNPIPYCLAHLHQLVPDLRVGEIVDTWNDGYRQGLEAAARVVDQCNQEGPYNAIGAATRIRALKIGAEPDDGVLVPRIPEDGRVTAGIQGLRSGERTNTVMAVRETWRAMTEWRP